MVNQLIFITLLSFPGVQDSAEPAPGDPVGIDQDQKDLAGEVERRFLRLISLMGKLLAREEELEESGRLQQALKRSRELKIVPRLENIRDLLKKRALEDALEEEIYAEKDLQRILLILQGEDEAQKLREETDAIREITEQLERLQRIAGDQEENIEDTREELGGREGERGNNSAGAEQGEEENNRLARREQDLQRKTRRLAEELEREAGRNQQGQQQGQQGRQQQGQQGQQQQGQQGQQQQGQQGQQGQQQQGQQGRQQEGQQQQGQQQGQQQEGQQQQRQQQERQQQQRRQQQSRSQQRQEETLEALRRAQRNMQDAVQRLEAENLEGALEDQEDALAELNRSQDRLRQERERLEQERREKVTSVVLARLYTMLADQELIGKETSELEKQRKLLPADGRRSSFGVAEAFDFASRSLARRERSLATDAEDILRVLTEDASSVVAPEILRRIMADLENVSGRLDDSDTGPLVQVLQEDVETSLKELIEALQPARNRNRMERNRQRSGGAEERRQQGQQQQQQEGEGEEGEQDQDQKDLITPVMELRMLISAQRRVRARTARWNELGVLPAGKDGKKPGRAESSKDQELRTDQAKRLSEAQEALGGLTDDLIRKYPIIDQFLLGMDLNQLQGLVEGLRPGGAEASEGAEDKEGERGGSRLRRLLPPERDRGADSPGGTESAEEEAKGEDGDE